MPPAGANPHIGTVGDTKAGKMWVEVLCTGRCAEGNGEVIKEACVLEPESYIHTIVLRDN